MKDPEISIKYLVTTNPESKIEKLNELYGKVWNILKAKLVCLLDSLIFFRDSAVVAKKS